MDKLRDWYNKKSHMKYFPDLTAVGSGVETKFYEADEVDKLIAEKDALLEERAKAVDNCLRETLLDRLMSEYQDYCNVNGLPQISADEQKLENLERPQRNWMFKFMAVWDIAQDMEKLR